MTVPASLSYYGGKSSRGVHAPQNRWLVEHLPRRPGYAEPFCGMLGVLLARPRARVEIAGDADGRVTNWWRAVRHQPDELSRLIRDTPQSGHDFELARRILDDGGGADAPIPEHGDLRRAWAFFVVVSGSTFHGPEQRTFNIVMYPRAPRARPEIHRLAERLRDVVLLKDDAVRLVERLADRSHFSLYVDPPYGPADTTPYGAEVDRPALVDALRRQRGAVAVSGYEGDFDELDWRKVEFPTTTSLASGDRLRRTDCLWVNFDPRAGLFG